MLSGLFNREPFNHVDGKLRQTSANVNKNPPGICGYTGQAREPLVVDFVMGENPAYDWGSSRDTQAYTYAYLPFLCGFSSRVRVNKLLNTAHIWEASKVARTCF